MFRIPSQIEYVFPLQNVLISTYVYFAESKENEQAMRTPNLSLCVSLSVFRHAFCCKPVIGFLVMLVSKEG